MSAPVTTNKIIQDDSSDLSTPDDDIRNPLEALNATNGRVEPATPQTNGKTNGHTHDIKDDLAQDNDEPQPKRRRTEVNATPPPKSPSKSSRKPKLESPPWKRFEAEGPTTYTENGRRKSGRVNALPLELPPQAKKRITRAAITSPPKSQPLKSTQISNGSHNASASKSTNGKSVSVAAPKSTVKKPASESRPLRPTRRTSSPPPPTRHSTRRRSGRIAEEQTSPVHTSKYSTRDGGQQTRIKLRIGRPGEIPLVHPDQVRKRPKLGTTFQDFWIRGADIPVEEGGLLASEDGPALTDEQALKDARLILRIEEEAEPGGLLSQERCSLFTPDGETEPPRQWARQDHMMKAMANFRRLMTAEHRQHRSTAKRLAEACRDEWIRRQPKSAEQIEAEERDCWILRYRLVVKALFGTWENVRAEVNQARLEKWHEEEQRRVKAALNQAVSLSELKLQARQAGLDSEMVSEDDGFSDMSDELEKKGEVSNLSSESDDKADNEDSDNMSDSDDDEEEHEDAGDEGLTQEQLRAKYSHVTSLDTPLESGTPEEGGISVEISRQPTPFIGSLEDTPADDTSDESVDMDDDMDSTDMSNEEEEEDESSEGEEEETGGLLGLFFGKSELKQIKTEAGGDATPQNGDDTDTPTLDSREDSEMLDHPEDKPRATEEVVEEDAISLVPLPGSSAATSAPSIVMNIGAPFASAGSPEFKAINSQDTSEAAPTTNGQSTEVGPGPGPATNGHAHSQFPLSTGLKQRESEETKLDEMDTAPDGTTLATRDTSNAPSQANQERKTEIPFLLRGTLREYQHDGLDWLAGLYANNTNGILADEMGLGKTIQTISLLAHLACHHGVWGPHLVIVPTSVMLNWEMEFKKWCPGFKILAYYGSQEERKRKRQGWNNDDIWNVCITSYQLVLQDQQVFRRRRWHYMILDEAHNIKNFKSQRWRTLLNFNTHSRLLLTGTPLQNNLAELWSLLYFLMPPENDLEGFADLKEFQEWFHKPEAQILESGQTQMDDESKAIISKLHKVLRPYLLRRLKADVEKQMPGKYEHVEFCRLSKRQRELYDGYMSRADTKEKLAGTNNNTIFACLMQLRKVCNHPDLFVDRPIMTSFKMQKSIIADYAFTEQTVHRRLLAKEPMSTVNLGFLNFIPVQHERLSTTAVERITQLSSNRTMMDLREAQKLRAHSARTTLDPSTVESNITYLESAYRWGRFEELQHCVYLNALRRQQKPIYGSNLITLLTIGAMRPAERRSKVPAKIIDWFREDSPILRSLIPSLSHRAESLKTIIEKFSCVTPAVVTRDLEQHVLGRKGVQAFTETDLRLSKPVAWTPWMPKQAPIDPWHEARMRHSIQFPDKRLLQYDCGKLQVLDKLLRKLQAGGHRTLIFTQMVKVLDVLERFLNIHGHKYLRLDGATKVEQRQILTDRFNKDQRILCFILSTRSGGLGINLTGADTVIFYDQDWNPAMDKQCQDRVHRIGQTRDVHIYRLISEHTIEVNILRKASQKQMLDDVVIQDGDFTTDSFRKRSIREVLDGKGVGVDAADAALERVLGGEGGGRVFEVAEEREDVSAARAAEKEILADEVDFEGSARQVTPAAKSALDGGVLLDEILDEQDQEREDNAWGGKICSVDEFMLASMHESLRDAKLNVPRDKKKSRRRDRKR